MTHFSTSREVGFMGFCLHGYHTVLFFGLSIEFFPSFFLGYYSLKVPKSLSVVRAAAGIAQIRRVKT